MKISSGLRSSAPESRIAKQFVLWSYATSGLTITSGILLVPFYLGAIGKENYGVWAAVTGYCAILSLFELGVSYMVAQRCGLLFGQSNIPDFRATVTAARVLGANVCGLMIAATLGLSVLAAHSAQTTQISAREIALTLIAAGAGTSLSALGNTLIQPAIATGAAKANGVLNVTGQVILVACNVAFLQAGFGLYGLGLSMLAKGLSAALIGYWFAHRFSPLPRSDAAVARSRRSLSSAIRQGVTGRTLYGVFGNVDILIVTWCTGAVAAADYQLSTRVIGVASMLLSPLPNALFGSVSRIAGAADTERLLRIMRNVLSVTGAVAALFVYVVAVGNDRLVRAWVGPGYSLGPVFAVLLAAAYYLNYRCSMLNLMLLAGGAVRDASRISGIEATLRTALALVLVPHFGPIGVPLAACIVGLCVNLPMLVTAYARQHQMSWVVACNACLSGFSTLIIAMAAAVGLIVYSSLSRISDPTYLTVAFVGLFASAIVAIRQSNLLRSVWQYALS